MKDFQVKVVNLNVKIIQRSGMILMDLNTIALFMVKIIIARNMVISMKIWAQQLTKHVALVEVEKKLH